MRALASSPKGEGQQTRINPFAPDYDYINYYLFENLRGVAASSLELCGNTSLFRA